MCMSYLKLIAPDASIPLAILLAIAPLVSTQLHITLRDKLLVPRIIPNINSFGLPWLKPNAGS
jgi:hypothetical protein